MLARLASLIAVAGLTLQAAALGTNCTTALGSGSASGKDAYWLEGMKHQGLAAFNADPSSYTVFRNVMTDYGAKGDGVTDDTDAINKAISDGSRCSGGAAVCNSSTITPALVYFPSGTYLVSTPIEPYYYTQLVGDARTPPTILAAAGFTGFAVIDADVYIPGGSGAEWYTNQNNFYRSIRNFVIDLTKTPATASSTGIHWQVSQATSLINIVVNMSTDPTTAHQGIFMENGSGGFMGDLVFNGGKFGIWVGNQQFTVRNLTISGAQTAVFGIWNWGWTFQGVTISDCGIGFNLTTGGLTTDSQTVGAEAIIDAVITDTPIFIQSSVGSTKSLAGSLVLNNIKLSNVTSAVAVAGGTVILKGSDTNPTIDSWGQGNVYTGTSGTATFTQGTIANPTKAASLLDSSGNIFGRGHPQYEAYSVDEIVSARAQGAKGDGKTDDTKALQALFDAYAGCKIIFIDAGTYIVTSTLKIPVGAQVTGEAWSVIMGSGDAYSDMTKPSVVVQAGAAGDSGTLEISDIIFSTVGPSPGAIVLEWNVAGKTQGSAGMWDSHIRLGGAAGTNLQDPTCSNSTGSGSEKCQSAFLSIHLTNSSSGYFEGTWVWNADHNLDGSTGNLELELFSGRGILSESGGPVWLIGTASEHHVMYQYSLIGAKDHYMGLIQTETPYFQPTPAAPAPFTTDPDYSDPTFSKTQTSAWGLYVENSQDIFIFGAGHYSFFTSYDQACLNTTDCQSEIVSIDSGSSVNLFSVASVATTNSLSIGGSPVIKASDNVDGFQSTFTSWSSK
ncbi:glycoside hydrolase family 55 protein [Athelia psychrophila]|uniref:Glycoside hydrolase family 55 protein n=1 Tax=Athelia psychrophila TaxID=1759441 RepID=A0A166VB65_9AGAM|nr:glycoside hydrolase family 55 protein [Fibularhizoctonia sp. CBS 109695]